MAMGGRDTAGECWMPKRDCVVLRIYHLIQMARLDNASIVIMMLLKGNHLDLA